MFETKKVEGIILNISPIEIKKKDSDSTWLTEVRYCIKAPDTDKFRGFAILKGYANGEAFKKLENFVTKIVPSVITIESRPTETGCKYYILSVNDIKLK